MQLTDNYSNIICALAIAMLSTYNSNILISILPTLLDYNNLTFFAKNIWLVAIIGIYPIAQIFSIYIWHYIGEKYDTQITVNISIILMFTIFLIFMFTSAPYTLFFTRLFIGLFNTNLTIARKYVDSGFDIRPHIKNILTIIAIGDNIATIISTYSLNIPNKQFPILLLCVVSCIPLFIMMLLNNIIPPISFGEIDIAKIDYDRSIKVYIETKYTKEYKETKYKKINDEINTSEILIKWQFSLKDILKSTRNIYLILSLAIVNATMNIFFYLTIILAQHKTEYFGFGMSTYTIGTIILITLIISLALNNIIKKLINIEKNSVYIISLSFSLILFIIAPYIGNIYNNNYQSVLLTMIFILVFELYTIINSVLINKILKYDGTNKDVYMYIFSQNVYQIIYIILWLIFSTLFLYFNNNSVNRYFGIKICYYLLSLLFIIPLTLNIYII